MLAFLRKTLPENFFLRRWYSAIRAVAAAFYYGFPAQYLQTISVTGTDGKTTTTAMISHILRRCQKKILSITTAEIRFDHMILPVDKRTTPDAWKLQKLLKEAVDRGIDIVVLEASSHAISQHRIYGIDFDAIVLTNITPEHLDYHHTFVEYQLSKKSLFINYLRPNGTMVLNHDDAAGRAWSREFLAKGKKVLTYSTEGDYRATRNAEKIYPTQTGISFFVRDKTDECHEKVTLPIFGSYNVANAMAAMLAVQAVGIYCQESSSALASFPGIPGRMEKVNAGQSFSVFVDFALTPGAFSKLLKSTRRMAGENRVILVFGSPGSHPDADVRREIGRIVAGSVDLGIITDDETYFANPAKIRAQIMDGAWEVLTDEEFAQKIREIPDRKAAISAALKMAQQGDIVIISGMGHMTTRNVGGVEMKWSDVEVIQELLAEYAPAVEPGKEPGLEPQQ